MFICRQFYCNCPLPSRRRRPANDNRTNDTDEFQSLDRGKMSSFRLRNMAPGLLVFALLLHGAAATGKTTTTTTQTCSLAFDDVASNTVLASVIFEGRPSGDRTPSTILPGNERFDIAFKVGRVFKGDLPKISSILSTNTDEAVGDEYLPVVVGPFGEEDREGCVADSRLVNESSRRQFLVFLVPYTDSVSLATNSSRRARSSKKRYRISSFPIETSQQAVKTITKYSCQKCARLPKVKITNHTQPVSVDTGKKVQLYCRATTGKPPPKISWYKDDVPLRSDKNYQFKTSKSSLRLTIRRVRPEDYGTYKCMAQNVLGQSEMQEITVKSESAVCEEKPKSSHLKCCQTQNFCLNGGTCYIVTTLGTQLCECPPDYFGNRCGQKMNEISNNKKLKRFKRLHGSHSP